MRKTVTGKCRRVDILLLAICFVFLLSGITMQTARAEDADHQTETAAKVWFVYSDGRIQEPDEKDGVILRPEDTGHFETSVLTGNVSWNCEERFLIIGTGYEDHKWIDPVSGAFCPCENVPTRGGVEAQIQDADGNVYHTFRIRIVDEGAVIDAVLRTEIQMAERRTETLYTSESWSRFQTALTEAKRIYEETNTSATVKARQSEIDQAAAELRQAAAGLEKKASDDKKDSKEDPVPVKPSVKPTIPAQDEKKTFQASAKAIAYNKIKITWKKQSGVSGYKIYRAQKASESYRAVATVSSGKYTYTDTKIITGKTYYYKVRAFVKTGAKLSGKSDSKVVHAKTTLEKTTITNISGKNKKVNLKWKKVKGASGYQIYRADRRNGKYRCVKTQKTTKLISKTQKAGKTCYYKVRAYRNVNKKKVYSSFSKVRKVKVK